MKIKNAGIHSVTLKYIHNNTFRYEVNQEILSSTLDRVIV